jgi:DNA-binding response OmpR family regulator
MSLAQNAHLRIVVVEDDRIFARVLEKRLSADGYQVVCAGDGREGMKAIVEFDPDLVISDWMMPHVDGLELCQSVKTGLGEAAPYFILLTARGEISDKVLALDTGADDYLVKPCEPGELRARVRAGLRCVQYARLIRRERADNAALRAELDAARDELRRAGSTPCPACGHASQPRAAGAGAAQGAAGSGRGADRDTL